MEWSDMKRNFLGKIAAVFAVCLMGFFAVKAQTGTTSIHGTVTDKSGAVISAAKVTVLNPAQGSQREVDTNETGEFEFLALQP